MVPLGRTVAAAGRRSARRLALFAAVLVLSGAATVSGDGGERLLVTESNGTYTVTAAFAVTEAPADVIAVLTDYERIPKFMPDVEVSRVVQRTSDGVVVEQEAVSRFMMFSKRVHLMLDVREDGQSIRFRDRGGKSFSLYHGAWTISQHDSITVVDYQLSAKPVFEVPAFVLRRLLRRDAELLIARIRNEIRDRRTR